MKQLQLQETTVDTESRTVDASKDLRYHVSVFTVKSI
jgi:hypothetical protein